MQNWLASNSQTAISVSADTRPFTDTTRTTASRKCLVERAPGLAEADTLSFHAAKSSLFSD
ncbi:MAG: hypothetical protein QOF74_2754 [Caballeronia mineralivorans]|nr:hypothetical protein [Caballeronia mineralivorans]